MIRFIHITDTHIGPHKDYEIYGVQSYPCLVKLVDEINSLPFKPDFIVHTGDVVDDGADASYRLAREILSKLNAPIYYVAGNHDDAEAMQSVLLGKTPGGGKLDYIETIDGVQFVFLDTRGPKSISPAGELSVEQLDWLLDLCEVEGPPVVILMHHSCVPLDTPWLDHGGKSWGGKTMLLRNHDDFRSTIAFARNRIKAVHFGHVHGSFQIVRDGILYVAAPSAFAQLENWPNAEEALLDAQPPGFNIVTIDGEQFLVRNRIVR